jgi:hypothetical protein
MGSEIKGDSNVICVARLEKTFSLRSFRYGIEASLAMRFKLFRLSCS